MARLSPTVLEALRILATHSGVGWQICNAAADGKFTGAQDIRKLCTLAEISQSRVGEAIDFLREAQALALVQQMSETHWRVIKPDALAELAPALQAIHLYRHEVHQDANRVDVVLNKPPNPSMLAKTLEQMLMGTWGLLDTRGVLPAIAEKADARFVVMTPFLDEYGAELLLSLYQNLKKGIKKQLILRVGIPVNVTDDSGLS
jgi:hypothetical protein